MRILVADDDAICRCLLETTLQKWGHDVVSCSTGGEALRHLSGSEPPELAILDWMMPELDGPEVCREVRSTARANPLYLVLLTTRSRRDDVVEGLNAGADDYMIKPFDLEELRARVLAGGRIVQLQAALSERVRELESALAQVKQLQGLLPICSYCKRIRDDENYWEQVELYIGKHSHAQFSHGICPACFEKHVRPQLDEISRGRGEPTRPGLADSTPNAIP
ncbi:MAG: response regulator transcription factor [Deltaproteobacteria bacterium]|nr:response regulator transcription factor [Deltaproteobacteria bacterium]